MGKVSVFFLFLITSSSYAQLVFSHRGGASLGPENTLFAFQTSIDLGVEYYELDLRVSSDDSLVIMHDASVDRTTDGTGSVSGMTFDQLRALDPGSWFSSDIPYEKIPTLEEALKLTAPSNTGIIIEIKATSPTTIQKIIDQVYEYNMQARVIIAGFSFANISAVKAIDSSIAVMQFGNYSESAINKLNGISGEWYGTSSKLTKTELDYAHSKNILLNKWTINSAEQMLELKTLGVDAITTDYPQLLIALTDSTNPSDVVLNQPTVTGTKIQLSWLGAIDNESGIANYEIYRDTISSPAILYKIVKDTVFTDEIFTELKTFFYKIKAKNIAGLTSINYSNEVSATTERDNVPPVVSHIISNSENTKIIINFSERVDQFTAEDISNYSISNSVEVLEARLSLNLKSVILKTSILDAMEYTLTLNNILDLANTPNTILLNSETTFSHIPLKSGIVLHFGFDGIVSDSIYDAAISSDNAILHGPVIGEGIFGNALRFDGVDDYADIITAPTITDAVTISAWVNLGFLPVDLPGNYGPIFDSETDNYILYEDKGAAELRFKVATVNKAERPGIPSADLVTGEWIHVVGVYDGAKAMVYLNAELKDTHVGVTGKVKAGQTIKLGESLGSFFKGEMDNIQVFNYALSQTEIDSIYTGKTVVGVEENIQSASQFELTQNYPNPFNPATTIKYSMYEAGFVTLKIYNILGQEIITLVNKIQSVGVYNVSFDASQFSTGVYIYRIQAGDFTATKKMILIK